MEMDQSEDAKRARSLFGGIEPIAPLGYQRMADAPQDQRIIGVDASGTERLMRWHVSAVGKRWAVVDANDREVGGIFSPIGWKPATEWGFDL